MTVSIVIPVLNEAAIIARTIESCRAAGRCEIIIVDGGSTDGTLDASREADCVLLSRQGRARQLNTGAATAQGEILLFLHADCQLSPGSLQAITELLAASPATVGGCFRQRITDPKPGYRCIEWGNALRVRLLGWIYGDQGLFVRREVFEKQGGFPDLPLMEDLVFAKKLRRVGKLELLPQPLMVDARRWERNGVVRQTLRNWAFVILWHCGVSPQRLARWYTHVR